MQNRRNGETDADLKFFGRVNASISHELKNIMAIISETAGLMNDLMEMAAKGKPMDPETVMSCSTDIIEEIQRGFAVIRKMNRFSHSVDETVKSVDIGEAVELTAQLTGFLSFAGQVRIDAENAAGATVETAPFRLHHLIYLALVAAFRSAGPDGEVHVRVRAETEGAAHIHFSNFGKLATETFPEESIRQLAASIGTDIHVAEDARSIQMNIRPWSGL